MGKVLSRLLLVTITIINFSCQNDEIKPRTTPRFSLAYIQSISNSGVEFAANVFDYGSESILEYGFLYSSSYNPNLENSEIISRKGSPPKNFVMRATHSMEYGKTYRVAAFILTKEGLVMSQLSEFVSLGSNGFIFERILMPTEVYYGDTIQVFGRDFSRDPANYHFNISGNREMGIDVFDISETSFKAIIPKSLQPGESDVARFTIAIAQKLIEVELPMKFKAPVFYLDQSPNADFDGVATIFGDYLESPIAAVRFEDQPYNDINIIELSKEKIVFSARNGNPQKQQSINLLIRGKNYFLENAFSYNPSEIDRGQVLEGRIEIGASHTLTGRNFRLGPYFTNEFISEPSGMSFHTVEANDNSIRFELGFGEAEITRRVKIWSNNAGIRSENYAEFIVSNPTLPFLDVGDIFGTEFSFDDLGRGITVGDKLFFIWKNKIISFDPEAKKLKIVKEVAINVRNLAGAFAILAPNSKIYIGSYNRDYTWQFIKLYEFDPFTAQIKELPSPPTGLVIPKYVYATENSLYLDGGFARVNSSLVEQTERFKFDLNSQTWGKMDKKIPVTGFQGAMKTFRFQNKLYAVGWLNWSDDFNVIQEFSPATEEWITIKTIERKGEVTTNQPIVIDNQLFLFYGHQYSKVDLSTLTESHIRDYYWGYDQLSTVTYKNKIYTYAPGFKIFEIDPEYFTY